MFTVSDGISFFAFKKYAGDSQFPFRALTACTSTKQIRSCFILITKTERSGKEIVHRYERNSSLEHFFTVTGVYFVMFAARNGQRENLILCAIRTLVRSQEITFQKQVY